MKSHHFIVFLLFMCIRVSPGYAQQTAEQRYQSGLYKEEIEGELDAAIKIYETIISQYPENRPVAAKVQLHIGICKERLGMKEAQADYQRVVDTYPDQTEMVALAKTKLTQLTGAVSESTLKAEQSFKLAGELYKEFKYELAITEYEKVIQLSPKSRLAEESRLWIGQCYFKERKYDRALASYNSILKEYPQSTIVPVTELMISQLKLAIAQTPKKRNIITINDKTILDPETGIRYTKINTWTGKYDIIKSAASITDIAPNRKFLVADNKVIPFDQSEPYILSDTTSRLWYYSWNYRLSPDAAQIAFFTTLAISVIPVFPETGIPAGPVRKLYESPFKSVNTLNWSPDGEHFVFSKFENPYLFNLWYSSTMDTSIRQVTNLSGRVFNPVFSKDGSDVFYKCIPDTASNYSIRVSPLATGKSITIVDTCRYNDRFILSPDNRWIVYNKTSHNKYLLRLADNQKQEFSTPEEVGDFVSWADEGRKVFFYSSSYEPQNLIKVASVSGGPVFECGGLYGQYPVGWLPDSKGLIFSGLSEDGTRSLKMISLINQDLKDIDGTENPGAWPSLSPDCSRILVGADYPGKPTDLSTLPFSLKDYKVTGKPVTVFKGFDGYGIDCSWSPDGKKIAVCHGGEVWICQAEGGAPLQLTRTEIIENFPRWSPDGASIAVFLRSSGQLRILRASDGEVLRTFEMTPQYAWSPGGKEIAIADTAGQLISFSWASGRTRKIANWEEISPGFSELKWSPDGKWIAAQGIDGKEFPFQSHLYLINAADGKSAEIATDVTGFKQWMIWSPDSKWIAFCKRIEVFSNDPPKTRLEGTLWEADLTDFMNKK